MDLTTKNKIKNTKYRLFAIYFILLFLLSNVYALSNAYVNLTQVERFTPQFQVLNNEDKLIITGDPVLREFIRQMRLAREEAKQRILEARTTIINNTVLLQIILTILSILLAYFLAAISIRPLLDAIKKQEKFLMDASHQLKTPLTNMRLQSEFALSTNKLATYKEAVRDIDEETKRMQELIDNMLYLSRMNNTTLNASNSISFNLSLIIKDVLNNLRMLIKEKEIEVNINSEQELEKTNITNIPEDSFKEILKIILENAVKYNVEKGNISISIDNVSKIKGITLRIEDTGIGIPAKDLNKVFERFYRSNNHNIAGSGLGLSILQELTTNLNIGLELMSVENKGTTILLTIPQ